MRTLCKRSSWTLPAVTLVAGVLALGLAGCGGDNNSTPTVPPAVISNAPAPPVVAAQNPQPVVTGQGATIQSGAVATPANSGGVTGAKVVIPPNSVLQNGTLAVEVVPTAQGTIARLQQTNPDAVAGITPIAEIAFGPVGANGKIDTTRPIVFGAGNVTISLPLSQQGGDFGRIQGLLASGRCVLVVRQNVGGQLVIDPNCAASLDTSTQSIVLTGNCSGDLSITCETVAHQQGGAS